MSENSTYNGWANYATWRIQLEVFADYEPERGEFDNMSTYDVRRWAEDYVDEMISDCNSGPESQFAISLAYSFVAQVDWTAIAEALLKNYADENTEDENA